MNTYVNLCSETVRETLEFYFIATWLMTKEDITAYCCCENFRFYTGKRDPQRMATHFSSGTTCKGFKCNFIYKKKMINTLYNITWFRYRRSIPLSFTLHLRTRIWEGVAPDTCNILERAEKKKQQQSDFCIVHK